MIEVSALIKERLEGSLALSVTCGHRQMIAIYERESKSSPDTECA